MQKDFYFSVFGDYNMRGQVERSTLARTALNYYNHPLPLQPPPSKGNKEQKLKNKIKNKQHKI